MQLTSEAQTSRANKERLEDVIRREEKDHTHMKHSLQKCTMDIEVRIVNICDQQIIIFIKNKTSCMDLLKAA